MPTAALKAGDAVEWRHRDGANSQLTIRRVAIEQVFGDATADVRFGFPGDVWRVPITELFRLDAPRPGIQPFVPPIPPRKPELPTQRQLDQAISQARTHLQAALRRAKDAEQIADEARRI